jgi:glutamate racemase
VEQVGTGLVELVENGNAASDEAYRLVSKYVRPMVEAGADNIVLGCTHYPFLMDAVRRAAGPGVEIVNPAPSVALQARRMLLCHSPKGRKGHSAFYSSSETSVMSGMVRFIAPDIGCSFSGNIVI